MESLIIKSRPRALRPAPTLAAGRVAAASVHKAWSHERKVDGKCEWLTPPEIIRALGPFDLDPCAAVNPPWPTARRHSTVREDGLLQFWSGRVWLPPPYDSQTHKWLAKLADHGDGVALIFARTDTAMFFDRVWNRTNAVIFLRGRLTFLNVDGSRPNNSGGAPSCLVAYGQNNARVLGECDLPGCLIQIWKVRNRELV